MPLYVGTTASWGTQPMPHDFNHRTHLHGHLIALVVYSSSCGPLGTLAVLHKRSPYPNCLRYQLQHTGKGTEEQEHKSETAAQPTAASTTPRAGLRTWPDGGCCCFHDGLNQLQEGTGPT